MLRPVRQIHTVITADLLCVQVVERLLSLPADYWSQFVNVENEPPNLNHLIIENANCYSTPDKHMSALVFLCQSLGHVRVAVTFAVFSVSMLGPLTTPEQQLNKTPSSSSLSQRFKSTLTPR